MQNEADRLLAARTGATLADLMLARGAQLAGPAPRTAEQAVTAAEVVAEAEAITAEAVDDTPCACVSGSCRNAHWHTACTCTCGGHAHGETSRLAYDATRAKAAARFEQAGGVFADLARAGGLADLDDLVVIPAPRPFNASPIVIDGEVW